MSGPNEFWVYRKTNGCVSASNLSHPDEDGYYENTPVDGPDGAWELLDRDAWDLTARPCLRGRCGHTPTPAPKTRSVRERRAAQTPVVQETWQEFTVRILPLFNVIKDQYVALWQALEPAVKATVWTMHAARIEGPHDGLCPGSKSDVSRCFCMCAACWESNPITRGVPHGWCDCAHCGCRDEATS